MRIQMGIVASFLYCSTGFALDQNEVKEVVQAIVCDCASDLSKFGEPSWTIYLQLDGHKDFVLGEPPRCLGKTKILPSDGILPAAVERGVAAGRPAVLLIIEIPQSFDSDAIHAKVGRVYGPKNALFENVKLSKTQRWTVLQRTKFAEW